MSGRRVLIVDDSVASLESLAIFFEFEGYEVATARDGVEGVAAVTDFKPAVVFMDIEMPNLDGNEAAGKIRASHDGGTPKLVALTGWTREEDRKDAEDAGFDRVLFKPVTPDQLRKTLTELFPDSDTKNPSVSAPDAGEAG